MGRMNHLPVLLAFCLVGIPDEDTPDLTVDNRAADDPGCDGCDLRQPREGGWCYMFNKRPAFTPCGQYKD